MVGQLALAKVYLVVILLQPIMLYECTCGEYVIDFSGAPCEGRSGFGFVPVEEKAKATVKFLGVTYFRLCTIKISRDYNSGLFVPHRYSFT
jgi:hypothetical protein